MSFTRTDIAVIGAGIAGIATAYYLCKKHKGTVLLLDRLPAMSFTSAQSGDNYRNWWPHPVMTRLTDQSIDLMEQIVVDSDNAIGMSRRGYVLATREALPDGMLDELAASLEVRTHRRADTYTPNPGGDWREPPAGADVLDRSLIRRVFPGFSNEIAKVVHIRRAGDFNSQQLAQYLLQRIAAAGASRLQAKVLAISHNDGYTIEAQTPSGVQRLAAGTVVNAAGPFAGEIATMLGVDLPLINVLQQKLLFEDTHGAVPRQQPFSIDLDRQQLAWSEEERSLLASDEQTRWLTEPISGGVHCRPEGGAGSAWVKLGWAYNRRQSTPLEEPRNDPYFDPQFAEIVMRGASALQPELRGYIDEFPINRIHYGGYYTMTPENWPLLGPMDDHGAFMICGLSGFGSMAACAAGSLVADWIAGSPLPRYARRLSLARYDDSSLIAGLRNAANKGLL